ncbi:hypothetical protein HPB50_021157 [Hyalomma asiaticum]|uniref:Uncharacterized protein n=1 Tax=Hyalomma asiaticum TaxID=266040 RepID=A0ACB7S8L3_HYAAI|nr:hypothetical protein HPB50_021157 [Hyalomma asiaticum]
MVRAPYGESSDQVVDEGQHGHELSSGGHSAAHGARSSAEAGAVLQPAIYAVRAEHVAAGALDGIAVHTQADRAHEFIRRPRIEVLGRIYDRVPYKFDRRIKDAPRKLRRGATSHEEGLAIVAAVADNPRCSAQEIKVNLGLKASKSTVKRRQAGLKSRTAEQKVLLRTDNKDKRLQFAQRHAGWIEQDWNKAIFTDESTFTTCWEQKTRIRRPDCTL